MTGRAAVSAALGIEKNNEEGGYIPYQATLSSPYMRETVGKLRDMVAQEAETSTADGRDTAWAELVATVYRNIAQKEIEKGLGIKEQIEQLKAEFEQRRKKLNGDREIPSTPGAC